MNRVIKTNTLPINSKLHFYCKTVDYCDSFGTSYNQETKIEDITQKIFSIPSWVNGLLKIRDFIVKPFGLQTSDQMYEKNINVTEELKQKLPFSLVEIAENEIVMHEKDRHLNFWVSVMINENMVYMTTVVEYNNIWGKIYFSIIKPFHSILVRNSVKKVYSC